MEKTINEIKEKLEELRPFLQKDGGDVEFIKFDNGVVHVNMKGACSSCASIETTLKAGIEAFLTDTIEDVKEVVQATDEDVWESIL